MSAQATQASGGNGGGGVPDLSVLEVARDFLASRAGTGLGPPGGEIRALVMAPTDPDHLYVGTSDGHFYVSRDGAATWRLSATRVGHDAAIDNIVVHPQRADVAYAAFYGSDGHGGLLRTDDGGDTWRHLDVPADPSLRALAVAPSRPDTVYVGGIGGVWRSDDGGARWRSATGEGLPFQHVESLAVDPRDPERVYAGTWRQAYRTVDGGTSWSRIHQGMAIDRDVFSVTIDPRDPDRLLAGTCNFIYVSSTGGDTWSERREGLAANHNRVHIVAHDPVRPEVLYAGTRGALYRSDDAGGTWSVILAGISVSAIQIHPSGSPVYLGTEERGVLVSRDGMVYDELNAGISASRIVAFDALPGAPRVLFAARSEGPIKDTVFYSTDVGTSWKRLGFSPYLGRVHLVRAQIEPVNRVLVIADNGWWSVVPGGLWSPVDPAPGELQALEIAHGAGGIVLAATDRGLWAARPETLGAEGDRSTSRGWGEEAPVVWTPILQGEPLAALSLMEDRFLAAGPGLVVRGRVDPDAPAGIAMDEVQRLAGRGLPEQIAGLTLHGTLPETAYAVAGSQVFRSVDGGAAWQTLDLPWPAADLRSVAVDRGHPDQVLALDYRGAIYRGHDDGRFWLILDEDPGLYRAWKMRVSPQAPGLALVATQGHGLRVVALDPSEHAAPTASGATGGPVETLQTEKR